MSIECEKFSSRTSSAPPNVRVLSLSLLQSIFPYSNSTFAETARRSVHFAYDDDVERSLNDLTSATYLALMHVPTADSETLFTATLGDRADRTRQDPSRRSSPSVRKKNQVAPEPPPVGSSGPPTDLKSWLAANGHESMSRPHRGSHTRDSGLLQRRSSVGFTKGSSNTRSRQGLPEDDGTTRTTNSPPPSLRTGSRLHPSGPLGVSNTPTGPTRLKSALQTRKSVTFNGSSALGPESGLVVREPSRSADGALQKSRMASIHGSECGQRDLSRGPNMSREFQRPSRSFTERLKQFFCVCMA